MDGLVSIGDLHPTPDAAKLFTVLYIVAGLGVLATFISELTKHRASTIARLRPHDDPSAPGAGDGARGVASSQPEATDETRT